MNNQAYLISKEPILKCVIFTEDLGPILIESESLPNIDKPCISKLALLNVERFSSSSTQIGRDPPSFMGDFVEEAIDDCSVPIFVNNSDCTSSSSSISNWTKLMKNGMHYQEQSLVHACVDESTKNILKEIENLGGLQERLHDASIAITNNNDTKNTKGSIELFLARSENIAQEFVSTLAQNRQSRKRPRINSSTRIIDEADMYEKSVDYYRSLYEQCLEVEKLLKQSSNNSPNKNTVDINEELTKVNIIYHDEESRAHELVLELNENFPIEHHPIMTIDLPIEFTTILKEAHSTIKQSINDNENESESNYTAKENEKPMLLPKIFYHFRAAITRLQPFWQEMDDIDSNCLILEPSLPARRSYVERRIALTESISIHLVFDPDKPRSSPLSMKLSGASEEILKLRKAYQNYIIIGGREDESGRETCKKDFMNNQICSSGFGQLKNSWNDQTSIRSNLQECFNITLPSPITDENLDFVNECGICYSNRLLIDQDEVGQEQRHESCDEYPDISCLNKNCGRRYHRTCMMEWLQSLPNSKISFDRIHGTCMYCCELISVKIVR